MRSNKGIFKLFATLRSKAGIKPQFKATCNPGGPGHHWVKAWAVDIGPNTPVTDPVSGLTRVFIPAKLADNPALLLADPMYVNRLKASGSPELRLEGDWNVLEGAFFSEFSTERHVLRPFEIPHFWTRFRSGDWGSAVPYSFGWYSVVQDDTVSFFRPGRPSLICRAPPNGISRSPTGTSCTGTTWWTRRRSPGRAVTLLLSIRPVCRRWWCRTIPPPGRSPPSAAEALPIQARCWRLKISTARFRTRHAAAG